MPIVLKTGDLLKQDGIDAIVNTVNCVGVMGKGIALQFKQKWPGNFKAYAAACKRGEIRPGRMFVWDSGGLVTPNFVINFPTKDHWRGKSKLAFVRDGLADLVEQACRLGIRSIAVPPLGCGNGGLDWNEVRPLIEAAFAQVPEVTVFLYEPAGAPAPQSMESHTERPRMTRVRAALIKLLEVYRSLNYGLTRIEVQKLAYFLQCAGEDMSLDFVPHEYGPYSEKLRHALQAMEGHYILGLGDGVVEAEIAPVPEAIAAADVFLGEQQAAGLQAHIDAVAELVDGFQSPYGLELLATVHWVLNHPSHVFTVDETVAAVHAWSPRKRAIMSPEHIGVARHRVQLIKQIGSSFDSRKQAMC